MSRTRLASLLWDRVEPEQARNLLRGAIHEVRASLEPAGEEILVATREHVSLRRDLVAIDVDERLEGAQSRPGQIDVDTTEQILLDGFEHTSRSFDEWLANARASFQERLRSRRMQAGLTDAAPVPSTSLDRPPIPEAPLVPNSRRGRSGIRIGVAPIRPLGVNDEATALALTHELSAALSEFRWISVPAPDQVAAVLGPDRNIQAALNELDLDFLLEGQIQTLGGKLRLRTSLVSALETAIVWTFKTVRETSDLLASHEEIAAEIATRIDYNLLLHESQRIGSSNEAAHDVYGLMIRAVRIACSLDPETFASAGEMLAKALQLEPERPMAHLNMAQFYLIAASQGWVLSPAEALQKAEIEANVALSMDPSEAQAWAINGYVRSMLYRQPEEAVPLLKRSIAINPNLPIAWHFSTGTYLLLGDLKQARDCMTRYEQLGPTGVHFFGNSALVTLCMLEGNNEEAVRIGRTTLRMHPNFIAVYKPFAAALGHLGLTEEAAATYAQLMRLEPTFKPAEFLRYSAYRRPEDAERYAAGLQRAAAAASACASV